MQQLVWAQGISKITSCKHDLQVCREARPFGPYDSLDREAWACWTTKVAVRVWFLLCVFMYFANGVAQNMITVNTCITSLHISTFFFLTDVSGHQVMARYDNEIFNFWKNLQYNSHRSQIFFLSYPWYRNGNYIGHSSLFKETVDCCFKKAYLLLSRNTEQLKDTNVHEEQNDVYIAKECTIRQDNPSLWYNPIQVFTWEWVCAAINLSKLAANGICGKGTIWQSSGWVHSKICSWL